LPQGLLEKIELQLLLPEPTLEFRHTLLRTRQIVGLGRRLNAPLRTARPPQLIIAQPQSLPPFVQPLSTYSELARQCRHLYSRRHQGNCRSLELDRKLRELSPNLGDGRDQAAAA
jgi:hypothetical protein